ncbi:hypothetical protein CKAH01_03638 [Colletotrichum kahawae]|uniref:Uncharacterized protein n=1 Tax=Colletotrichum kahawae TaxID=34407 RepID=A0AAD9YRB9_COLKA|nr:hypothetical protein CKAH01_03638 [Colletotrichum kahawae]
MFGTQAEEACETVEALPRLAFCWREGCERDFRALPAETSSWARNACHPSTDLQGWLALARRARVLPRLRSETLGLSGIDVALAQGGIREDVGRFFEDTGVCGLSKPVVPVPSTPLPKGPDKRQEGQQVSGAGMQP